MDIQTQKIAFADRVKNVPQSFIREILKVTNSPNIVSFAGGLPNPIFFPVKELEQCAANVFNRYGTQALQYAATEGYTPLRDFIAKRYREIHGLDISADQILITNGSQQALDLIGKLFINPGDNLCIERPAYLGALQCFSMYQPEFIEVELKDDGIDTESLQIQLNSKDVKLFYSIPNFQNPTGIRYSLENRKKVCDILRLHRTILVEDDPYGDLSFSNEVMPTLYSFLPDQTILLGSFSKTIAPGLRLGWMVANEEIIKKAAIMKQASDLHSGNLSQYILYEFLSTYNFSDHIQGIRDRYKAQCNTMTTCLNDYFRSDLKFTRTEGGMFTWLRLQASLTARELLNRALKENIIFVPGDTFYASNPDPQTLRLNFSNVNEEVIRTSLLKLSRLM